jgi:ethanolamine ammonia-lyase large subunit
LSVSELTHRIEKIEENTTYQQAIEDNALVSFIKECFYKNLSDNINQSKYGKEYNISDTDLYSYNFMNGDITTERELKKVRKNMLSYIRRNVYYLLAKMKLKGSPKTNINRDRLERFVDNYLSPSKFKI